MENLDLAKRAVSDSKEWLSSAEKSMEIGAFSKAIYAMEMGVEMSLKALLLANGVDFPKVHNIITPLTRLVVSDKFSASEIKNNLEQIISVFHALLDLRSASAYSYESSYDNEFFRERAVKYLLPAREVVEMVGRYTVGTR